MKKLNEEEMKMVIGGLFDGGGDGSCTYGATGVSCTSATGNCQNLYCHGTKDGLNISKGVCCDGIQYAIANGADDCAGLGGTLCCDT
jgi:hypothetical protein